MGSDADGDTSASERRAHPAVISDSNHDPTVLIYSLNRHVVYTPSLQAQRAARSLSDGARRG
eukprot:4255953-Alexandrium_andersonii.AAC.1